MVKAAKMKINFVQQSEKIKHGEAETELTLWELLAQLQLELHILQGKYLQ